MTMLRKTTGNNRLMIIAAVVFFRTVTAEGASPTGVSGLDVTADPLVDIAPIVSWTVSDGSAVTKTVVQTSLWEDHEFADVSEAFDGAGNFVFTNLNAAVGARLYYRLRCTNADGDAFSDPVAYRRVRQLERTSDDQTKLAPGASLLPVSGFTMMDDITHGINGEVEKAFDGDLNTASDYFVRDTYASTETVVGVNLPEASHVTDVYMYPRATSETRLSDARVLAATTRAELETHNVVTLAGCQTVDASPRKWYRYQSEDVDSEFRCVFAYDGLLDGLGLRWWCGNVAEVRFYGWSASDEAAAGLRILAPAVTQDLIANAPPVVSWRFTGDVVTSARLQYAEAAEGPWQDLGDVRTVAGEYALELVDLLPGLPVYFRVAYTSRLDGEHVSEVTSFRRVRQLERADNDQTSLAEGVTTLPVANYTVEKETKVMGDAIRAFDGDVNTFSDAFATDYSPVETVVGVCLSEAVHVTDIFMYPRAGYVKNRLADASVLACTSKAAFDARKTFELAPQQSYPDDTLQWYRYQSRDVETLYQCLFAYSGPLVGRPGDFAATVAEIRFYGWTLADEAAAGLRVAPPQVEANLIESSCPVVSWQVNGSRITSSQVEYSYSPEGPFAVTGTAKSGAGSFDCTVADSVPGLVAYYRVRYTMEGSDEVFVSAPTAFRRVRQLERAEDDQTTLAAGVTTLPEINYSTYNEKANVARGAQNAFDGDLATNCDLWERDTYAGVESVVGVCLPEAAHVTDVFMHPRSGGGWDTTRMSDASIFACTSHAAFEAHETHRLSPRQSIAEVRWYQYKPDDSETLYQCLFAYAGPLDNSGAEFSGNVVEIRFYGWTPSDVVNATVLAPTGIVLAPGVREVRLRWADAVRADTVRVERRVAGESAWSIVAASVPAESGEFTDVTVAPKTSYEYRLVSVGLNGRMEAATETIPVETGRPGFVLTVR